MKSEEEIRAAIDFNEQGAGFPGPDVDRLLCQVFADALKWVLSERKFQSMDQAILISMAKKKLAREAANQ